MAARGKPHLSRANRFIAVNTCDVSYLNRIFMTRSPKPCALLRVSKSLIVRIRLSSISPRLPLVRTTASWSFTRGTVSSSASAKNQLLTQPVRGCALTILIISPSLLKKSNFKLLLVSSLRCTLERNAKWQRIPSSAWSFFHKTTVLFSFKSGHREQRERKS